jgi:hypothetical protein
MKTLFDPATRDELIERLDKLTTNTPREWGKMSPAQMMEHTARALEMATGRVPMDHATIGKLIGWVFKKKFLSETPFPKNSPTGPTLVIKDDPDFEATRERLRELITAFHQLGEAGTDGNVHGFFGRLTGPEWGISQYKHVDHHLRQFGM